MKRIIISMFICSVILTSDIFTASRKKMPADVPRGVDPSALVAQLKSMQTRAQGLSHEITHGAGVTHVGGEAALVEQFFQLLTAVQHASQDGSVVSQLQAIEKEANHLKGMGFVTTDFIIQQVGSILNLLSEKKGMDSDLEVASITPALSVVPIKDQIFELIQRMTDAKKTSGKGREKKYSAKQIEMFIDCIGDLVPLLEAIKSSLRIEHCRKIDKAIRTLTSLQRRTGKTVSVDRIKEEDGVITALGLISSTLLDAAKKPFFSPTRGMPRLEYEQGEETQINSRMRLVLVASALFLGATLWHYWEFLPGM